MTGVRADFVGVQGMCPKHGTWLVGSPRLYWDPLSGWTVSWPDARCPAASVATDCIATWKTFINFEEG